jgi:CheY-like chemotaxis protein
MRILLVENDPEWQDSIRRGLPDHEVKLAPSYDEALACLDLGPEYALAIVDLNLNDSKAHNPLDGLGGEVLEHLRKYYPSTRRIALTAYPAAAVRQIFERFDIDELLLKQTLAIADLRIAVRASLARAGTDTPENPGGRNAPSG